MGLFDSKGLTRAQAIDIVTAGTVNLLRQYVRSRRWPERAAVDRLLLASEMETGIEVPRMARARATESITLAAKKVAPDKNKLADVEWMLTEAPGVLTRKVKSEAEAAAVKKHLIKPIAS